jgi:hypothetical protein
MSDHPGQVSHGENAFRLPRVRRKSGTLGSVVSFHGLEVRY